jgi:hypothetical protein
MNNQDDEMDKIDMLMWIDSHFSMEELKRLIEELKKIKNDTRIKTPKH